MAEFETEFERHFAKALEILERTGSVDVVHKYIEGIPDEDYRDGTFEKMARFLGGRGQVTDALRFCASIHYPLERADALIGLARELRSKRLSEQAKAVLREAVGFSELIDTATGDRATILIEISVELHDLGESDEALDLLRRAAELSRRTPGDDAGLAGCARVLARWSLPEEARAMAETIKQPGLRDRVLKELLQGT